MTGWIELTERGIAGWRCVEGCSSVPGWESLSGRRHGKSLTVSAQGADLATVDGWAAVTVRSIGRLEARLQRLQLCGLAGDTLALHFEWPDTSADTQPRVRVTMERRQGPEGAPYVKPVPALQVFHGAHAPLQWRTTVRVESALDGEDAPLLLACVSYFWNHFDLERRRS